MRRKSRHVVLGWTGYLALPLLCQWIVAGAARGDLVTAVNSSFALTANAQAGTSPNVTNTDVQSQGSTTNGLSVGVSADSIYAPTNENLLATATGSATWSSASNGQVNYTNVGWSDSTGSGIASLMSNTGWTYTFTSNVTGSFIIDYTVTGQGTSSTSSDPQFGLNGFYLYEGVGLSAPQNATSQAALNTSGIVTLALTAGQTYTVQIRDFANIDGVIGATNASMDGTFNFSVQAAPEPSSFVVCLVAGTLVGAAMLRKVARRQRRT